MRDFSSGGGGNGSSERQSYPPYIHFTLQKTNRDTQDALQHLSRALRCNAKELSVAGTKDKRGVTVQRVSLKRGNKTVEQVWKLINGVGPRRTAEDAVTQRGDRGIRASDFKYSKGSLELGMLKGNAFVITLRYSRAIHTNLNSELTVILQKRPSGLAGNRGPRYEHNED